MTNPVQLTRLGSSVYNSWLLRGYLGSPSTASSRRIQI